MKLTHLKMDAGHPKIGEAMEPEYPFGCCLSLSQSELEKLGFTDLPHAGESFTIEARAVVVSSGTEDPDADGDIDHAHVRLQLTHLGIEGDKEHVKKNAKKMYGGDKDKAAA